MKKQVDILVIGGGAIGICCAHFIRKLGRNVTVVERGEICCGSSYGNAGLIVPSSSIPLAAPGMVLKGLKWMFNPESPFYIKPRLDPGLISWLWRFNRASNDRHVKRAIPLLRDLNLGSLKLFEELASIDGLDFGFEKRGLVAVYKTRKGFEDGIEEARLVQKSGLEIEVLSVDEIQELERGIRVVAAGGVYYPQDAHVVPHRFVNGLAGHIQKNGVDILTATEVLAIEASNRRVKIVKTTRGDFAPDDVVLAGGSWSPGIVKDLGINLPIQPAKGYSITFRRPPVCPAIPMIMAENKVVLTPMGDTMRFAGTLELAGLDLSINRRRVQAIFRSVPLYLPDLAPSTLDLIEIWRGLRPCTPDGLPFIGRPHGCENLIVAAGHATIGMSLSPITGKLVSRLIAGERPQIDLSLLSLERFG